MYYIAFSGKCVPSIERQLAEIYRPLTFNGTLTVKVLPVQQQQGSVDCGLFAISFALAAAQMVNTTSFSKKR